MRHPMRNLTGENGLGSWVSLRYIKRFGTNTKMLREKFHGKQCYITTDKGLWRPEAAGSCRFPADAGQWTFEEAYNNISHCGPEKHAKIYLVDSVPMKEVPIEAAKRIANEYGYEQVIVYARKTGENGGEHMTTYGIDKVHCDVAAKMGDHLKYNVMSWTHPETED